MRSALIIQPIDVCAWGCKSLTPGSKALASCQRTHVSCCKVLVARLRAALTGCMVLYKIVGTYA